MRDRVPASGSLAGWPRGPGRGQSPTCIRSTEQGEDSMPTTETPNPSPPAGEAITPEVMVAQVRAMRDHVPEYTQLAIPDAQAIRRVAHVNPELVQAAINSMAAAEGVQTVLGVTAAELQRDTED